MKPRLLEIQAFGPYLKKTSIDFTPLYNNGLFLITGSTGSGKTTILDAMSFAIYGLATGAVRDCRDMRNIAAEMELDTRVRFEMELFDEKYAFERAIIIKVKNKRDGTKEERAENEANCYKFINNEWKLITTGTGVTQKAEELLGFSHQQFSQVVVLPQGEFRKLLIASSKDKQEILRKLFGTQRFENYSTLLTQKAKELRIQLTKYSDKEKTLCENVGCDGFEQVFAKIEENENLLKEAEKKKADCKALYLDKNALLKSAETLQSKFTELADNEKKEKNLALAKNEIESERNKLNLNEKATGVIPYYNSWAEAENALKQDTLNYSNAKKNLIKATEEATKAEENAKNLDEQDKLITSLSNEISKLEVILKSARSLKEAREEISVCKSNLIKKENNLTQYKTKKESLDKEIKDLQVKIEDISENYISKLPDFIKKQAELNEAMKNFSDMNSAKVEFDKKEITLNERKTEYRRAKKLFDTQNEILEKEKLLFDEDTAFKLSESLEEGKPCPVCGSLVHPNPAKAVSSALSKEELEDSKANVEKLKVALDKAEQDGRDAREAYTTENKLYLKYKAVCDEYNFDFKELETKLKEVDESVKKCNSESENQKKLKLTLTKQQENLKSTQDLLETFEKEKNEASEKLSSFKGKESELLKAVGEKYSDVSLAESETKNKTDMLKSLTLEVKNKRENLECTKEEYAKTCEREKALKLTLENSQKRESKAKEELISKLMLNFNSSEINLKDYILEENLRISFEDKVKSYDNEVLIVIERKEKLSRELEGKTPPKTEVLREESTKAFNEFNEKTSKATEIDGILKNLLNVSSTLEKIKTETEKLSKDYALYDRMASLSSGANPKKTPIGQFVLGLMLQDIVASANIHLSTFSKSRYSLVKSEDLSRGNGSKGLELSVNDAYSGKQRSVNTLSGGEMFLASLSLAFGLSDVVQSYSGGIRLDSLFIDEGFGSLDTETLEISMNALQKLRSTGRLIGVISHVSELSERIHDKIVVDKNQDSSAKVTVEIA